MTEIVDGSCIIRVRPLNEECLEYSEKYVGPLGYQGNNLLCSNWNIENMQDLDYNGIFEYLYNMKYGRNLAMKSGVAGVTADEFESVIMTYLPVTAEELKEWACMMNKVILMRGNVWDVVIMHQHISDYHCRK